MDKLKRRQVLKWQKEKSEIKAFVSIKDPDG